MIAVDWGSLAAPNPPQSRRVREAQRPGCPRGGEDPPRHGEQDRNAKASQQVGGEIRARGKAPVPSRPENSEFKEKATSRQKPLISADIGCSSGHVRGRQAPAS